MKRSLIKVNVLMNITDDSVSFNICTLGHNDDTSNILKNLLLSTPSNELVLCLFSLNIWKTLKSLFFQQLKNGQISIAKSSCYVLLPS